MNLESSRKPLLLIVIDTLQTGGAEKSMLEIARRLVRVKPLVCTLFSRNADLAEEFRSAGIEVVSINANARFWWFDGAWKLRKMIRERRPDLVHAVLFRAEVVARLAIDTEKTPLIGSFVNDSYAKERYQLQTAMQNAKLNVYRFVDALTARRVKWFTSITNSIARTNAEALGIPEDRIHTIYRGRNISRYTPAEREEKYPEFTYITVARLLLRKGYLELLKAVRRMKNAGYSFRVHIVGDGPDRAVIEESVRQLEVTDYVKLLGTRTDVPELLRRAHCFVFPSHYEGQGGALVEAMLTGLPIIATDIPVFREQIDSGKTGLLFELRNDEDLMNKMVYVMQHHDHAKTLGLNARAQGITRFDIASIAAQCDTFYLSVIQKAKAR